MGETTPPGVTGRDGRLDGAAARVALAALGREGSLDVALDRLAEVVGLRFGADCVVVGVQRRGKGVAWWPREGEASPDRWQYPMWQQDGKFLERVATEGPSLCRDTLEIPEPTPGQRAAIAAGVRSSLRMPLTDEQGRSFGFVLACSFRPGAFDEGDLRELLDLGREAGGMLRMRLLLERLHFEHALRTAEADLLAKVAEAEEEGALLEAVAEGVAKALGADMAAVAVDAGASGMRMLRTWPRGLIRAGDWAAAEAAVDAPGNVRMLEGGGSWVREDLAVADALPVEVFLRDRLGVRSLAVAVRSRRWGGLGLALAAARREPGRWHSVEREFLAKVARVVEIGVERLRRGELAVRHALSLEQQAELLGVGSELLETLWQAEDQASAAQAIAERLRQFFGADHVALGTVDLVRRRREVLGMSSAVMRADELGPDLDETAVAAYREALGRIGEPAGDLFARCPSNPGTAIGWDRGLRSGMRVPFALSDGTVGLVTVGSRQAGRYTREDEERLIELSRPMAVALDRVRLLGKMAETSDLLAAKTRVLLALTPGASIEAVGDVFVREVRRIFGATHALVLTQTPAGAPSLRASTEHFTEEELAEAVQRAEANGTWRAAIAAGPQLVEDARVLDDRASRVLADHGLRSVMRAPIRDETGRVCGVATLARPEPRAWNDAELAQFAELASTLGLVLERAALLEAADAQARRAAAVLEVLGALGPGETLEAVAGRVATALRGMYGADHCAIGVVEGQRVRLAAIDSVVGPWAVGEWRTVGEVFDAWPPGPVVHVFDDLRGADKVTETTRVLRERGLRSSMRVAVTAAGEVCGVVTVGSLSPGRFGGADAEQLAAVVQPLAVAIRYFRGREEEARQTARLEGTNRVLARLTTGGSPERLAQRFLADCRELFGARFGVVLLFDGATGEGRQLAAEGLEGVSLEGEWPLGRLRGASLLLGQGAQVVEDARREAPLHEAHRALLEAGLYSVMRVPLMAHETVRGSVALWGEGTGRFAAEDAELLATLARPLALALERAAALESLAESELKYRSLVAQAEEMILTIDASTRRVIDANPFAARVLGYAPRELQGLRLDDISFADGDELAAFVERIHRDGEVHLADVRYRKRDGSPLDVEVVASLVAYGGREAVLVLARDVSERKALMAQLMQSQKMESLGTMAGAVAHDFNNLLTTILGFAGLLKRSPNMDREERENLALIEEAARKAADLTGRLLSFSRGGLVRFGRVDLQTVVEDTLQLLAPTLARRVAVEVELPAEPVLIEGDAGQLQQALTNIILNARDVMLDGGRLEVRAGSNGPLAWVRIADTGPGMSDEVRMRIFEPFFTTKPPGSGTGLGMAITYGIVQGHHGDITVESEPGRGTAFTLSFPLLEERLREGAEAFSPGEGNLVLIVDDDPMVRRATTATLGELGYNVVEAPGGSTAVEVVRARPDRFAAVLLDLVMPGMTGAETFRALLAIRADLPVVICTGYAADSHMDADLKRRIAGLVQKPFTAERLARALEAAGVTPPKRRKVGG